MHGTGTGRQSAARRRQTPATRPTGGRRHHRSLERLLLDFAKWTDEIDVTSHQAWADDLLQSNRFYREAASMAGDNGVADVLDDLERSLLDIVHGPSTLTRAQLETMLVRLDAATLLFKVRVLADELHERELTQVRS
jgi:hypothetical protein